MIEHHWFRVQLPSLIRSAARFEGADRPHWLRIQLPSMLRSAARMLDEHAVGRSAREATNCDTRAIRAERMLEAVHLALVKWTPHLPGGPKSVAWGLAEDVRLAITGRAELSQKRDTATERKRDE